VLEEAKRALADAHRYAEKTVVHRGRFSVDGHAQRVEVLRDFHTVVRWRRQREELEWWWSTPIGACGGPEAVGFWCRQRARMDGRVKVHTAFSRANDCGYGYGFARVAAVRGGARMDSGGRLMAGASERERSHGRKWAMALTGLIGPVTLNLTKIREVSAIVRPARLDMRVHVGPEGGPRRIPGRLPRPSGEKRPAGFTLAAGGDGEPVRVSEVSLLLAVMNEKFVMREKGGKRRGGQPFQFRSTLSRFFGRAGWRHARGHCAGQEEERMDQHRHQAKEWESAKPEEQQAAVEAVKSLGTEKAGSGYR